MNIISITLIKIIKIYQFIISPFIGNNCRYMPTCSDYFIDCIKLNGAIKGFILGVKRILRCHPISFLGGSDGFDPAPNLKSKAKKK